jgi:hypothetical protein
MSVSWLKIVEGKRRRPGRSRAGAAWKHDRIRGDEESLDRLPQVEGRYPDAQRMEMRREHFETSPSASSFRPSLEDI